MSSKLSKKIINCISSWSPQVKVALITVFGSAIVAPIVAFVIDLSKPKTPPVAPTIVINNYYFPQKNDERDNNNQDKIAPILPLKPKIFLKNH